MHNIINDRVSGINLMIAETLAILMESVIRPMEKRMVNTHGTDDVAKLILKTEAPIRMLPYIELIMVIRVLDKKRKPAILPNFL